MCHPYTESAATLSDRLSMITKINAYYLQFCELPDMRRELHQVIVPHVQGPQALSQVGKVGREGRVGQIVVGQVQDLQCWEGAEPSWELTQAVYTEQN